MSIRSDLIGDLRTMTDFAPSPDGLQNRGKSLLVVAKHQHLLIDIIKIFLCIFNFKNRRDQTGSVLSAMTMDQNGMIGGVLDHAKDLSDLLKIMVSFGVHRKIIILEAYSFGRRSFPCMIRLIPFQIDQGLQAVVPHPLKRFFAWLSGPPKKWGYKMKIELFVNYGSFGRRVVLRSEAGRALFKNKRLVLRVKNTPCQDQDQKNG